MTRQTTPDLLGDPIPSEDPSLATMFGQEPGQEQNALALVSQASRMLDAANTIEEIVAFINYADMARKWAKRVKAGLAAQNRAAEFKLRGERKLGGVLRQMEKATGNAGALAGRDSSGGCIVQPPEESRPTYAELGIEKTWAMRTQYIEALPEPDFETYIAEIRDTAELTSAGALRLAQTYRRQQMVKEKVQTPLQDGKYRVWYADPPWRYNDSGLDEYGHAERHYPTMSIEELCEMGGEIWDRCDEDAVLFLWVTSPMLEDAFEVVHAWGFQYKTSFVWDKVRHNFGHYNSVRHELLLVCTRGSCIPDERQLFDSVQTIERTETHSEKPEQFRTIIDTLYPIGRRIELFARRAVENWEQWGNERTTVDFS